MRIWSIVRKLNFWQLTRLAFLMVQRPRFIFPTLYATRKTMTLCNELYGKAHHNNGIENAFRHALWNALIGKKVFEISGNETKSVLWAKRVTDLHEKIAPNDELATTMDLHNNKVGRDYFKEVKNESEEKMVHFIREQLSYAKLISKINEIDSYGNELVYIEN